MLFALFVLFVPYGSTLMEWPFTYNDGAVFLNVTVGTPGQTIPLILRFNNFRSGLWLSTLLNDDGTYNFKKSSTFSITEVYLNDNLQINATDNVVIQTKDNKTVAFKKVTMNVAGGSDSGNLYVNPNEKDGNSFVGQLMGDSKEQVAVFAYDSSPSNPNKTFTGTLSLGGRPDFCSKNWTTLPKARQPMAGFQWTSRVDGLKIANFHRTKPFDVNFEHDRASISLWQELYNTILMELRGDLEAEQIPCNSTKKIVFEIGGRELVLEPEDYVKRGEETKEKCFFNGDVYRDENEAVLPLSFFRDQCFLFDLKNKQLEVADRMKKD